MTITFRHFINYSQTRILPVILMMLLIACSFLISSCNDSSTNGASSSSSSNSKTSIGYCLILDADDQAKCVQFYSESKSGEFYRFCEEVGEDPFPITDDAECPEQYRDTQCEFDGDYGTGIVYNNENIESDEAQAICNHMGGSDVVEVN